MAHLLVVLSLLLAAIQLFASQEVQLNEEGCGTAPEAVVNGMSARPHQFPWVVFLELHFPSLKTRCGGSIITKRHVLTAAHCTIQGDTEIVAIYVIYGHADISRGARVRVAKLLRHQKYDDKLIFNDIAILLVEKPFRYGVEVKPICFPTKPLNAYNKNAVIAGWGKLSEFGNTSDHLQFTIVKIQPNEVCEKLYTDSYRKDITYCAFHNDTGSCFGDSGSPLFMQADKGRYTQVGIVSHGFSCESPIVYAKVEGFIDWVVNAIRSLKGYKDLAPQ
uniref:Tick serine protease n=1 Tax=Rhipicephalus zambeziensis TaxID=60191 RepID=A0A224YKP5_9ACAR